MAGTQAGGRKAAKKLTQREPNFFKRIGKMGGHANNTGGFASEKVGKDGLTGSQRAKKAGKIGGTISKRTAKPKDDSWQMPTYTNKRASQSMAELSLK